MAIASVGYSRRSLPDKLGYKDGQRALFIALPKELDELATSADFKSVVRMPRWDTNLAPGVFDLIHCFTTKRTELDDHLIALQKAIERDGTIWVSWPKKRRRSRPT